MLCVGLVADVAAGSAAGRPISFGRRGLWFLGSVGEPLVRGVGVDVVEVFQISFLFSSVTESVSFWASKLVSSLAANHLPPPALKQGYAMRARFALSWLKY